MPEGSLDTLLRSAIADKRLIQLSYSHALRVAEPHDYGVHKGVLRLLAFQLRGGSSRASSSRGWKLLDVGKITSCVMLDETSAGPRTSSTTSGMCFMRASADHSTSPSSAL